MGVSSSHRSRHISMVVLHMFVTQSVALGGGWVKVVIST